MAQSKNRGAILALARSMKTGVQKAIADGFFVGDDEGKLNLLKRADEGQILTELQTYWKLQYDQELLPDQELLQTREIIELFSVPEEPTRRQRPYQQKRQS